MNWLFIMDKQSSAIAEALPGFCMSAFCTANACPEKLMEIFWGLSLSGCCFNTSYLYSENWLRLMACFVGMISCHLLSMISFAT